MAEVAKWSKEMTLKLIKLYKDNECMWNRNSVHYRNRQMKSSAILAIAAHLGMHAEEVIRKLHNLRCQLNSEIRKIVRKRENGIPCDSSWELFDALLFMSDVEIPPLQSLHKVFTTEPTLRQCVRRKTYKPYQLVVKQDVLDDLIEVKYEVDDNHALYPYVQLDADESSHHSPEPSETVTLYAVDPPTIPSTLEPEPKRLKYENPDDEVPIEPLKCSTPDVFVDNPMADDGEDEARALGDFVSAEMRRIRSDERRKSLRKTIEEAVKAMVEEDEKEFFQDPATDPLS